MLHCSISCTKVCCELLVYVFWQSPAIPQQLYKTASRSLSAIAELLVGKQHQHTFKNGMHIQVSVYLHFYLLYFILNIYDMWYDCPCVTDALHQVTGVVDMCLVQYTHIPASVAKCCSRPGFRVNQTVWQTLIWTDKILLKELVSFMSVEWRQKASFPSQLFKIKWVIMKRKLNMHIIFESVLLLLTKNYQN